MNGKEVANANLDLFIILLLLFYNLCNLQVKLNAASTL